jgi:SAM-dependent methyltransferase
VTEGFSFEIVDAVDYDELRPGYAPEAVAWVLERGGLRPGSAVVDLAAGTGQLSRLLEASELDVVAVEPARNMREVLAQRVPSVRVLDGLAETIPLDDGSIDAVVVGNAFHHFERDVAFAEIRRVLRPGGALALFWAWPLEDEQLAIAGMRELYDLVERVRGSSSILTAYRSWAEPPATQDGFSSFERREFRLTHVLPSARLSDLYATSSDVASLPPTDRAVLLERIGSLSADLPETLHLPARTVVDLCLRATTDHVEGSDRSG